VKHTARKRFGQNFLVDPGTIARIVASIAPQPGDALVEIGPGLGALTVPLARALAGDALHVVELDRDLARTLLERVAPLQLVIHEADALRFDFAQLAPHSGKLRIVGNLPYNISSPLLFHLSGVAALVRDQHFMLQKEVVERMVASPGGRDYGRLSVMLQVCYSMELLFVVGPENFDPAPKVESAIVRMVPLAAGAIEILDRPLFGALVARAFSTRRKMLRNALAEFDRHVALADCGLTPTARAEDIAPGLYVSYANALSRAGVREGA
jgi:16S rRNA (adenine1518-N6/adenine1519-N6)-dimethyltransferase